MNDKTLQEMRNVSRELVEEKDEMARYNEESYLNGGEECAPTIIVSISNHPSYLRDFEVEMLDKATRAIVVDIALKQRKKRIKELTAKLKKLMRESSAD